MGMLCSWMQERFQYKLKARPGGKNAHVGYKSGSAMVVVLYYR